MQDVSIPEPQDAESSFLELAGAIGITSDGAFLCVLTSVELDDEALLRREKIRDERTNGFLTSELHSIQAPVANLSPEKTL